MADDRHDSSVSFKDTLNLPHTDFPIRADTAQHDPRMLERWSQEKLDQHAMEINKGNTHYIIHDGPPYANGTIHLGHAYNKILKDIIGKAYRMSGYHVPIRPGWDCHGLPIELKVTQQQPNLNDAQLKSACRSYAQQWIDIQRSEFKKLGVLMEWDRPYLTMNFDYEATVITSFGTLFEKKFIERKNKTVPWCPSCQTVLAAAEIEYAPRKDPSLYVLFELDEATSKKLSEQPLRQVYVAIWTTTPWTLPLNRAVLAKKQGSYDLIEVAGKLVLVGSALSEKLATLLGTQKIVHKTIAAEELLTAVARHPFIAHLEVPFILDDSVSTQEGTAFVHCAPGCGPVDYEIGVKNGLEIYAPISPAGTYTNHIQPLELAGMPVSDGQIWVIKKLAETGNLLFKTSITHSYPHCWRCHSGLIFRATPQWFFNLEHHEVKQKTITTLNEIGFSPESGKTFLTATIENRWEWCLSRQRRWGVPIPALICNECDYPFTTAEFIYRIAQGVEKQGVEYWDQLRVEELVKPEQTCQKCGLRNFRKERDILDVWFDAGLSHQAVLTKDPELSFPAQLYLEGIDQHRGWFQSSLLTSVALTGKTCTTHIMTHGFTVDARGQKMSKSLGNGVDPADIVKKIGTDGLRLWAASIGNDGDAVVSDALVANMGEVFRKIRNTCRGLLMNLYDFDAQRDLLPLEQLTAIDRYMLHKIATLNIELIERYHAGDCAAVIHKMTDFCAVDMSSLYLEMVKDRLYCEKKQGALRRSAQTVMWYALTALTRLLAPIMSFTAEHLHEYDKSNANGPSIHLEHFVLLPDPFALDKATRGAYERALSPALVGHAFEVTRHIQEDEAIQAQELAWQVALQMRSAVLKAIEPFRAQGVIKQSMEAAVTIYIDPAAPFFASYSLFKELVSHTGQKLEEFFKEFFVVSRVYMSDHISATEKTALSGFYVKIEHAPGNKCPRCWQWDVADNPHNLCNRCTRVLSEK